MIKYALVCDAAHEFESWFASSGSYDQQVKRGFVNCPYCQSPKVTKAVMAPNIARTDKSGNERAMKDRDAAPPEPSNDTGAPVVAPQQMALLDERQQALREMIRELHEKIVASSDDVGEAFPEEARKMHDGETPTRSIRGKASFEEARALLEDGIPVLPIPDLPEERN
ncbi:MAG: DUF1178 family protein [Beijerinckiaceae bacterium]|nr:DUF1178 family protein [Beijerinckiaceae bacterium]